MINSEIECISGWNGSGQTAWGGSFKTFTGYSGNRRILAAYNASSNDGTTTGDHWANTNSSKSVSVPYVNTYNSITSVTKTRYTKTWNN